MLSLLTIYNQTEQFLIHGVMQIKSRDFVL